MSEDKSYEGFIDLGVETDDVHEPEIQPTGAYNLTITQAKAIYTDKENGDRTLTKMQCLIDFDGVKNAASMFHNVSLPQPEEEPKKRNFKVVLMKKFAKLFSVPITNRGLNTTDFIGAKATGAFVELTEYDKGDGTPPKPSNKLNLDSIHV